MKQTVNHHLEKHLLIKVFYIYIVISESLKSFRYIYTIKL